MYIFVKMYVRIIMLVAEVLTMIKLKWATKMLRHFYFSGSLSVVFIAIVPSSPFPTQC